MVQKKSQTNRTVTVEQIRSSIRSPRVQGAVLKGLGLNKRGRRRVLQDTVCVRGMIAKVQHLVRVVADD